MQIAHQHQYFPNRYSNTSFSSVFVHPGIMQPFYCTLREEARRAVRVEYDADGVAHYVMASGMTVSACNMELGVCGGVSIPITMKWRSIVPFQGAQRTIPLDALSASPEAYPRLYDDLYVRIEEGWYQGETRLMVDERHRPKPEHCYLDYFFCHEQSTIAPEHFADATWFDPVFHPRHLDQTFDSTVADLIQARLNVAHTSVWSPEVLSQLKAVPDVAVGIFRFLVLNQALHYANAFGAPTFSSEKGPACFHAQEIYFGPDLRNTLTVMPHAVRMHVVLDPLIHDVDHVPPHLSGYVGPQALECCVDTLATLDRMQAQRGRSSTFADMAQRALLEHHIVVCARGSSDLPEPLELPDQH